MQKRGASEGWMLQQRQAEGARADGAARDPEPRAEQVSAPAWGG